MTSTSHEQQVVRAQRELTLAYELPAGGKRAVVVQEAKEVLDEKLQAAGMTHDNSKTRQASLIEEPGSSPGL